jgi:hypothetical protein
MVECKPELREPAKKFDDYDPTVQETTGEKI